MYLPVPGIEPTASVFLGECVNLKATVAMVVALSVETLSGL